MSLTHGERLRVVGCGLTGKLVRLLSLGTGCYFEPDRRACHKLMYCKVGRLAAKLMHSLAAGVGNKWAKRRRSCARQGNVPLQRLH